MMSQEQRIRIDQQLRQATFDGSQSPDTMRAGFAQMMSNFQIPDGVDTSEVTLGGRPALRVDPATARGVGMLLYFHGGAWVFGSPATALALTANLVTRTRMSAISLDYRLAPEHPFPAAIEDCVRAYRDLLDIGISPTQIVFAGDSAGGGLSITTMLAARSAGLPMPGAVVAFSPGLDVTLSGNSMETKAGIDPLFTRESLEAVGRHYLAGQDPHQELLSPVIFADLNGLAPMLLQVGSNEVLLDDSTRMAARAAAAGVDVILDVTADVPHVFQSYAGVLDEADLALDRAAAFIRQHIS
jgi:epsilon-lactone hydrolase